MAYLWYIYLALLLANVIVLRPQRHLYLRLLLLLLCWVLITQLTGKYLGKVYDNNEGVPCKNLCYRAYHFFEVVLLSYLYSRFSITRRYRLLYVLLPVSYFCFMGWYFTSVRAISQQDSTDFLAGSILIIFYALLYLYEWCRDSSRATAIEQYLTPFSMATLLFYSLDVSLLGFYDIIYRQEKRMADFFKTIQQLSNFPLYITYLIVFIRLYRLQKKNAVFAS